jgi:hypothetical protein
VALTTPCWLDAAQVTTMYAMAREWVDAVWQGCGRYLTVIGSCTRNFVAPSQKPLCGYGEKNVGFFEDVVTVLYSF